MFTNSFWRAFAEFRISPGECIQCNNNHNNNDAKEMQIHKCWKQKEEEEFSQVEKSGWSSQGFKADAWNKYLKKSEKKTNWKTHENPR